VQGQLAVAAPAAAWMQKFRVSRNIDTVLAMTVSAVVQMQHLRNSWWTRCQTVA